MDAKPVRDWPSANDPQMRGSQAMRVGFVAGVLWAVVGVTAAWLIAEAGLPGLATAVGVVTGLIALVVVERRYALHGVGQWVGAAIVATALAASAGLFFWTIFTYG